MSPAPHPRMHGLTHVRGGPDPIPGLLTRPAAGGYVDQVLAHADLVHYWRMGATGDQPDLAPAYTPVDLEHVAYGTAGDFGVAGALPSTQDDGAWESFVTGCHFSGGSHSDYFSSGSGHRANFLGNSPLTIECWLWPMTHVGSPGHGGIITVADSSFDVWRLNMVYPAYTLYMSRGSGSSATISSLGLTPEEWQHLAVTYDGTTTRFYLNGGLWHTDANTDAIPSASGRSVWVGMSQTTADCFFGGKIDEVALYTAELTADEILAHFEGGSITSGFGELGELLQSDGAAGMTYLGNGNEGDVLTIVGGVPTWAPP